LDAAPGNLYLLHRIAIPIVLTIRVLDAEGQPCVRAHYVLALRPAGGEPSPHSEGVTDERGCLRAPITPDVVAGTLMVRPAAGGPHWSMTLDLGNLRPAYDATGANARLTNLGHRTGSAAASGELDRGALASFAGSEPATATLDTATAQKLADAHLR